MLVANLVRSVVNRQLLALGFEDLEEAAARQNAFSLLKAVIGRRVVVPEVYDLMEKVQGLMVRSMSAPVRNLCASVSPEIPGI